MHVSSAWRDFSNLLPGCSETLGPANSTTLPFRARSSDGRLERLAFEMRTTVGGGANFFSDSGDDSEAFDIDDALAQWTQLDPDDGDDDSGLLGGTFGESPLLFGM